MRFFSRLIPILATLSFAAALAAVSPTAAQAFMLSPMSVSFEPSGSAATKSFLLTNNSAESIAVEISLAGREMDETGEEKQPKLEPLDKFFIVYPPQAILKPGEKRTVRVTWVGDAKPATELAYRLIAEQLPVDTTRAKNAGARIDMLLKYVAAIYVTPSSARPALALKSAKRVMPEAKPSPKVADKSPSKPQLELVFNNSGTAHQILAGMNLKITAGAKSIALEPSAIPEIAGQNVLPGQSRRFTLPWPKDLPAAEPKVEFELKP